MNKSLHRNPIYRAAYHQHFQSYGSTRFGYGPQFRNITLASGLITAGVATTVPTYLITGDLPRLSLSTIFMAGGIVVAARNGVNWRRYARLAHNFATEAADQLTSSDQIEAFFAERYPWLV